MTLSKEQITGLNRINAAAQKAKLGDILNDILTKIEARANIGVDEKDLDLIREELDSTREELSGILDIVVSIEEKIKNLVKTGKKIESFEKSLSSLSSKLDNHIKREKKKVSA